MIGIILIAVVLSSRYIKIEDGNLISTNPFLMQECTYELNNIEHTNNRVIKMGKGNVKNLTIELINKQIITLNAGLNTQKEIDEMVLILDSM